MFLTPAGEVERIMSVLDQAIRDQITRELFNILNINKSGDEILAERLKDVVLKLSAVSKITGLPASTLYRKVAAGRVPRAGQARRGGERLAAVRGRGVDRRAAGGAG